MPEAQSQFHVLVAGGGIGGLETVRQLIEIAALKPHLGVRITLLERNPCWGGRIQSVSGAEGFYEAGASRIATSHVRVASLVRLLGLQERRLRTGVQLSDAQREVLPRMERLRDAFLQIDGNTADSLKQVSWADVVRTMHGAESGATAMLRQWGFASMAHNMNAHDFWAHAVPHYCADGYYTLEGGLSTLVRALVEHIERRAAAKGVRVDLRTDCTLTRVVCERQNSGRKLEAYWRCQKHARPVHQTFDAAFLAMPADALARVDGLPPELQRRLGAVSQNALLRCYVRLPPPQGGEGGGLRVPHVDCAAAEGTQLVRASPTNHPAWVQASYTDHEAALHLSRMLTGTGGQAFFRRITKPVVEGWTEMDTHFWKAGTHSWRPRQPSDAHYEAALQPWPTDPLFVVGSCFSHAQHWIEGALETACDALRALCRHWRVGAATARSLTRVQCLGHAGPKATRKAQKQAPLQRWTMEQVRQACGGGGESPHVVYRGRVYDVTSVMPVHPGGAAIIRKMAGTDITRAFHGVGHTAAACAWLEEQCVGVLVS